jgi:hypothetical protein
MIRVKTFKSFSVLGHFEQEKWLIFPGKTEKQSMTWNKSTQ